MSSNISYVNLYKIFVYSISFFNIINNNMKYNLIEKKQIYDKKQKILILYT